MPRYSSGTTTAGIPGSSRFVTSLLLWKGDGHSTRSLEADLSLTIIRSEEQVKDGRSCPQSPPVCVAAKREVVMTSNVISGCSPLCDHSSYNQKATAVIPPLSAHSHGSLARCIIVKLAETISFFSWRADSGSWMSSDMQATFRLPDPVPRYRRRNENDAASLVVCLVHASGVCMLQSENVNEIRKNRMMDLHRLFSPRYCRTCFHSMMSASVG